MSEARLEARRGEPVMVLLRSGHMLKVGSRLRRERVCARRSVAGAGSMLGLPPSVRIYFATELVDMRKGP